jgi:hypothetical protein
MSRDYRAETVAIARSFIGTVREDSRWEAINADAVGPRYNWPTHWCGVFALHVFRSIGLVDWMWSFKASEPGFLFRLKRTTNPQPGDIAYFPKSRGGSNVQHHAIVVSLDAHTLVTIDGNTGDYGGPGGAKRSSVVAEKTRDVRKYRGPVSAPIVYYSIQSAIDAAPGDGDGVPPTMRDPRQLESDPPPVALPPTVPVTRDLQRGDRGDDVAEVQRRLMARGFDLGPCGADGKFGKRTQQAVRAFQTAQKVNGIIGADERRELGL